MINIGGNILLPGNYTLEQGQFQPNGGCVCDACKSIEVEKERKEAESYVPNPKLKLKVVEPVDCELCLCGVPKLTVMCSNNHSACKRCITKFRTVLCPFCRSDLTLPPNIMSIINENVSREIRERDAETLQMLQNEYGVYSSDNILNIMAYLIEDDRIVTV